MYSNATLGSSGLGFTHNRRQTYTPTLGHVPNAPAVPHAQRRGDDAANAVGVMQRRLEYLEGRERRTSAALSERPPPSDHWVIGDCTQSTIVAITDDQEAEEAVLRMYESGTAFIGKVDRGKKLQLFYPMHKVSRGNVTDVLMRAKLVEPSTAQIRWGWVRVFSSQGGSSSHYFRFS